MAYKKVQLAMKTTGKKKSKKAKTGGKLVTKAMLYKAINKSQEQKFCSFAQPFLLQNSSATTVAGNFYNFMPGISVGSSSNQRIGDVITPVKLVMRGYVAIAADSVQSQAVCLCARLMVGMDKAISSYNDFASINVNIIDSGGTSTTYNGSLVNHVSPLNQNMYKWVADKRFSFAKATGLTNATAINGGCSSVPNPNAIFKAFTITFTKKHLPAKLHYDSTENLAQPVNFNPFYVMGYTDPMTSVVPANGILGIGYVSTLYYYDA